MTHWSGHLSDPEATRELGARLGAAATPGWVVSLEGPLGSGKTTLTQGLAGGLGVEERLTSPTFVLESRYRGRLELHHFDLYRFAEAPSARELIEIGLTEAMFADGVCVIEWADRLPADVLGESLRVTLSHAETGRDATIEPVGADYEKIVDEQQRDCPGP